MKPNLCKIFSSILICWVCSTCSMLVFARETNLGDVTIRFCNDKNIPWWAKSIDIHTQTNKEEEICLLMSNAWSTPVKLGINFVDGSTTPDEEAKKACEPEWTKTNFGQYVNAEDTEFLIPAWETLQTLVKMKFPAWVAWRVNGCVTYNILDQSLSWDGMFKVFSRRANFIDVLVSGDVYFNTVLQADTNPSFPNLLSNNEIKLYENTFINSLSLKSYIINSGNISSQTIVSGEVQWRFWLLHYPLGLKKITTSSKKKSVLEYDLPKWSQIAWPLQVKLHITHNPVFPDGFTQDIKSTDTTIELHKIMIPRWLYLSVWVLMVAIFVNKKKHGKQ